MTNNLNNKILDMIMQMFEEKRDFFNLTDKEVLNYLNVSNYEFEKIKNGDESVNMEAVMKICFWLGVSFYGKK